MLNRFSQFACMLSVCMLIICNLAHFKNLFDEGKVLLSRKKLKEIY